MRKWLLMMVAGFLWKKFASSRAAVARRPGAVPRV